MLSNMTCHILCRLQIPHSVDVSGAFSLTSRFHEKNSPFIHKCSGLKSEKGNTSLVWIKLLFDSINSSFQFSLHCCQLWVIYFNRGLGRYVELISSAWAVPTALTGEPPGSWVSGTGPCEKSYERKQRQAEILQGCLTYPSQGGLNGVTPPSFSLQMNEVST